MMLHTRQKFALFALSIAAALVAGCGAPAAPAATATSPPPTAVPATSTPVPYGWTFPEVARVSLADAKAAFDEGSAIFVDVRQPFDYDNEHIPGAINIFFRRLGEHMDELDKQQWIITYCA